jgi:D-lactate dehydrogenase (cytochrome)
MRDNVINLTAVMPDGEIVKTGGRAKKSAAGYDLARLLIGSEGTLGVITELTLRLHGIPEAIAAGVVSFQDLEGACNATILTIQTGIPVARIELLDPLAIKAANIYSKMTLPETPTLFVEFHGSEASVHDQSEAFGAIAKDCGGGEFEWATKPEDRTRLWQARHDAYWASQTLKPGGKVVSTDACVPISRLAECVTETVADVQKAGIIAPIVGHVGDGNFHLTIVLDASHADEVVRVKGVVERLAIRAIDMEGTCTGEHGVGQGKRGYLAREHGGGLAVMKQIKRALDPHGIMNPGKIFEDV